MIVDDDDFEVADTSSPRTERTHRSMLRLSFRAGNDDRHERRGRIGDVGSGTSSSDRECRRAHESRWPAGAPTAATTELARALDINRRRRSASATRWARGGRAPTIVAAASWPVTLAVVRNMSGIVSTPSRMPMPSIGSPTLASTGTMAMIDPPGIPGMLKLVRTAVSDHRRELRRADRARRTAAR